MKIFTQRLAPGKNKKNSSKMKWIQKRIPKSCPISHFVHKAMQK